MSSIHRITLLFALCLAVTSLASAEALVKTLPQADTNKLPAEEAKQLLGMRAEFDKKKVDLVAQPLAEAYALMGSAYARSGFVDIAAIAFYDAAQLAPEDARWAYLQGVIAESKKQSAEARAYYEQAFKLDAEYFPIRYRVATAKIQQGDLDAAKKLMTDYVVKHTDQPVPYSLLAEIALTQKHYGEAIDALKKAQLLDPAADKLNTLLADAYAGLGDKAAADEARAKAGRQAIHMGDPLVAGITPGGDANADLLRAKIVDPNVGNDPVNQALMFYSNHQYDSARSALDEALKTHANDPVLLSLYARIDAESGDLGKARQHLQLALNTDAKNPVVLLAQGVIAEIGGDENAAADAYTKAVTADVNLAEAHVLLGNIEMRRGKFAQAAEQYRPATGREIPDSAAYARMVAAQVLAGHCAEAFREISAARATYPKDGHLAQIFVRLASTCAAVRQANIDTAAGIAQKLYAQSPTAENSEAIGLVMAAQGKFEDAAQYQTQAVFEAVRDQNKAAATLRNEFLKDYRAKKMPEKPWSSEHPYFKPARLAALLNMG